MRQLPDRRRRVGRARIEVQGSQWESYGVKKHIMHHKDYGHFAKPHSELELLPGGSEYDDESQVLIDKLNHVQSSLGNEMAKIS